MRKLAMLAGIAVTSLYFTAIETSAQTNIDSRWHFRPSIVGTWQVEVTIRENGPDCSTTAPVTFGINPFAGLHTYHAGGTLSETGSRSPPSRRSPGYGVWKRVGINAFNTRYTFQGYDPNGLLFNSLDFRSMIDLAPDSNTFTAVSRLDVVDVSGNSGQFCATAEGVRYAL